MHTTNTRLLPWLAVKIAVHPVGVVPSVGMAPGVVLLAVATTGYELFTVSCVLFVPPPRATFPLGHATVSVALLDENDLTCELVSPGGVVQVLLPLKNVVGLGALVPNLASGTVPAPRLPAFRFVRFAPLPVNPAAAVKVLPTYVLDALLKFNALP